MLYLLREIFWHKWRGGMLALVSLWTIYSIVIENRFPDKGIFTTKDILSMWDWKVWALIVLITLIIATFIVAYQKARLLQTHDNWIIAHKAKTGKLPAIPSSLLPLVDNYIPGKPISKRIKLNLMPSHQQWHRLTGDNKERFLQLIDYQGLDRNDFLQRLKDTAPPSGSAITHLRPKRKER